MTRTIAIATFIFLSIGLTAPSISQAKDEPNAEDDAPTRIIDLHVQHLELHRIIQIAAKESKSEFVLSKDIVGTCSLDMYDVTFEELLDVILPLHEARWYKQEVVIHIVTEKQFLERQPEIDLPAEDEPDAKADEPNDPDKDDDPNAEKDEKITIKVKELEIEKVMQLLSIQSSRSILVTGKVKGKVTAVLTDMSADQIIDHIVSTNGWKRIELNGCTCIVTEKEHEDWLARHKPEQVE